MRPIGILTVITNDDEDTLTIGRSDQSPDIVVLAVSPAEGEIEIVFALTRPELERIGSLYG